MNLDALGRPKLTPQHIVQKLYQTPDFDYSHCHLVQATQYNQAVKEFDINLPELQEFQESLLTQEQFDHDCQKRWRMPEEYRQLDIAQWLITQCKSDQELDRVCQELVIYHRLDLLDMLRYLKYLVDTLHDHNIVWGVGRGSSVASHVLYLIGIHRINSMKYQLDINEFLKETL